VFGLVILLIIPKYIMALISFPFLYIMEKGMVGVMKFILICLLDNQNHYTEITGNFCVESKNWRSLVYGFLVNCKPNDLCLLITMYI